MKKILLSIFLLLGMTSFALELTSSGIEGFDAVEAVGVI